MSFLNPNAKIKLFGIFMVLATLFALNQNCSKQNYKLVAADTVNSLKIRGGNEGIVPDPDGGKEMEGTCTPVLGMALWQDNNLNGLIDEEIDTKLGFVMPVIKNPKTSPKKPNLDSNVNSQINWSNLSGNGNTNGDTNGVPVGAELLGGLASSDFTLYKNSETGLLSLNYTISAEQTNSLNQHLVFDVSIFTEASPDLAGPDILNAYPLESLTKASDQVFKLDTVYQHGISGQIGNFKASGLKILIHFKGKDLGQVRDIKFITGGTEAVPEPMLSPDSFSEQTEYQYIVQSASKCVKAPTAPVDSAAGSTSAM